MENSKQSAFPKEASTNGLSGEEYQFYPPQSGLTKREYFAGLAMQALIHQSDNYGDSEKSDNIEALVSDAIEIADELLNQLSK